MGAVVIPTSAIRIDVRESFCHFVVCEFPPWLEVRFGTLAVVEDRVRGSTPRARGVLTATLARRVLAPDYLAAEILTAEQRFQQQPQVRVGLVIAVQVQRTCRLQYAFDLDQPFNHERQVSGKRVVPRVATGVDEPPCTGADCLQFLPELLCDADRKAPDILELRRPTSLVWIINA